MAIWKTAATEKDLKNKSKEKKNVFVRGVEENNFGHIYNDAPNNIYISFKNIDKGIEEQVKDCRKNNKRPKEEINKMESYFSHVNKTNITVGMPIPKKLKKIFSSFYTSIKKECSDEELKYLSYCI